MTAATKTAATKRSSAALALAEIFGGKDPKTLSAAELKAGLPKLESLSAEIAAQITDAERQLRGRALAIGDEDADMDLAEQSLRLQAERRLVDVRLEALRELIAATERRETEHIIDDARGALERELVEAAKDAAIIEEAANTLGDALVRYHGRIIGAVERAKLRLSGTASSGFRTTGSTMINFTPWQLQQLVGWHLQSRLGGEHWRSETFPGIRAVTFAGLQANASAELLDNFDQRMARSEKTT